MNHPEQVELKLGRLPRPLRKLLFASYMLLVWTPALVLRTVLGSVVGAMGAAMGVAGAVLGLAIAVPIVVLVLGIVFTVVPLALLAVALGSLTAVVTWPVRRAVWPRKRRLLHWEYWDEGGKPWEDE